MRQNHAAGEKLFVDYAGDTVTVVVDWLKGKTRQAHLLVAVLGASSLSYAEARWSETLPDWIGCHVNALEAFGGAPALLVPDNAKGSNPTTSRRRDAPASLRMAATMVAVSRTSLMITSSVSKLCKTAIRK